MVSYNEKGVIFASMVGILLLEHLYLFSSMAAPEFSHIVLFVVLLFMFFIFSFQSTERAKLILLIGVSFVSPEVSIPYQSVLSTDFDLVNELFAQYDRIQIRSILVLFISLLFAFKLSIKRVLKSHIYMTLFTILLFIIFISHDYGVVSAFQAVIDFGYIFGALCVLLYMRLYLTYHDLPLLRDMVIAFIFLKLLIIMIDISFSYLGVFGWAVSYRDGIQGAGYGMEILFSFSIGISLFYLHYKFKSLPVQFLVVLIGIFLLYSTNIKTAVGAYILTLFITSNYVLNRLNRSFLIAFLATALLLILLFYNQYALISDFVSARVYTVIIGLMALFDGNFLTGVMPGIVQLNGNQNLANAIATNSLAEYAMLVGYDKDHNFYQTYVPLGIMPHNAAIAILVSYGAIMLTPVYYYYIYMPISIFKSWRVYIDKNEVIIARVLVFILLFSLGHPFVRLIELVFFVEYFRLGMMRPILLSQQK